MKKCVVCQKDILSGRAAKVKEDRIIRGLRKIKQMLNIARNFDLYVCEGDFQKNNERRKQYEKNVILYTIIAVIVFVVLVGLPLLGGRFNFVLLLSSALLSAVIVLFAFLFKYVPATESQMETIPVAEPAPSIQSIPIPSVDPKKKTLSKSKL